MGLAGLAELQWSVPEAATLLEGVKSGLAFAVTAWYGRQPMRRVLGALSKREVPSESPLVLAVILALASGAFRCASWDVRNLVLVAPFLLLFHRCAGAYAGDKMDGPLRPVTWLVLAGVAASVVTGTLWVFQPNVEPLRLPEIMRSLYWIEGDARVGRLGDALGVGIAVLAAVSPISFVLAARAAREEAARISGERGMTVRDPEVMDRLRDVRIVAFDRIGTITERACQIEDILVFAAGTRHEVLEAADALGSRLPSAWGAAIRDRCAKDGIGAAATEETAAVSGLGATGVAKGRLLVVGLPRLMRELDIDIVDAADVLARCRAHAHTAVLVARDGVLYGGLALKDPLKRDSVRAIRALAGVGVRAALITVEARDDVAILAEQAGIGLVVGDMLPDDYANALDQLQSETIGRVLFVSTAEVDESLTATGSLIALMTTDTCPPSECVAVTISPGVMAVVSLLRLANESFVKMVQNHAIAIAYHAAVIPLSALGLVHPLFAGALSFAVCLAIGANTSRLRRWTV